MAIAKYIPDDKPQTPKQEANSILAKLRQSRESGAAGETTPMTPELEPKVLSALRSGLTITDAILAINLPSHDALHQYCTEHPAFMAQMQDAIRACAAVLVSDGLAGARALLELSEECLEEDPHKAKAYSELSASVANLHAKYAALYDQKAWGQLVKLADADGGKLSVQTVSYLDVVQPAQSQNVP